MREFPTSLHGRVASYGSRNWEGTRRSPLLRHCKQALQIPFNLAEPQVVAPSICCVATWGKGELSELELNGAAGALHVFLV